MSRDIDLDFADGQAGSVGRLGGARRQDQACQNKQDKSSVMYCHFGINCLTGVRVNHGTSGKTPSGHNII